jgi:DNA polymerase III subunit epsilon
MSGIHHTPYSQPVNLLPVSMQVFKRICAIFVSPFRKGGMIRYQTSLFGEHGSNPLGEIVVFDLETTGRSPRKHEIIQIAAAKLIGTKLARRQSFFSFVRPTYSIPFEITDMTGIRNSDVRKAPCLKDVMADFSSFCGDATLAGHNCHTFDFPFLRNVCSGIRCRQVFYFDTLHLSRHIWAGNAGIRHRLDDVMQRCGVRASRFQRHDARGDVAALARCIQRMFSHIDRARHESPIKLYSGVLPFSEAFE